jgi:hypothetical protein
MPDEGEKIKEIIGCDFAGMVLIRSNKRVLCLKVVYE